MGNITLQKTIIFKMTALRSYFTFFMYANLIKESARVVYNTHAESY
jgi:hypothetical protein